MSPLTIGVAFVAAAARVPGRVAIRFEGRDCSYAMLDRLSAGAARGLIERGFRPGDRIGVMMPNQPEFVIAVLAIARAGLVAVPIPARATERELRHIADDAGLRLVLRPETVAPLVESAAAGGAPDLAVETAPFFIGYTSGTTGKPKGAVISHRARTLLSFAYGQEYGCYTPGESHLITTPMYHTAGLSRALTPLLFGATVELHAGFDPERVLHAIQSGRATATYMVPTMFASLFELPARLLEGGRGRLRTVLSNASALPEHLKRRTLELWPDVRLFEIYGSSEAGTVTSLRPEDQLRKQRCVGLPIAHTEISIVGDDGDRVAAGEVGRLYSRSPFQFSGYLGDPEGTAAVMRDGFVTSGDLARQDDEGYVYIVGRASEFIVTGGVNVYPREVEEYLLELDGVREAAVFGVPDPRWGEAVHAVVVARPGRQLTVDQLREHCRRGLAPAKIPKSFAFREALPRTASGKVLKRDLIEASEA